MTPERAQQLYQTVHEAQSHPMKIVKGLPPNIDKMRAAFPNISIDTIFCYGDTIYTQSEKPISPALMAHERVHSVSQKKFPGGPEVWYAAYIADPVFRFEEELAAHRVEYIVYTQGKPKHVRTNCCEVLAKRLAGPLYGHMVTFAEAKRLILGKKVKLDKAA